jgi:hypothetical protein
MLRYLILVSALALIANHTWGGDVDPNTRAPTLTTLTGGDNLYRANVDSFGRAYTNGLRLEAVYKKVYLLNGASEAMNVNGSVTPVTFAFAPPANEIWALEGLMLLITDNANFGAGQLGAVAVTNGLVFEIQTKGVAQQLFNLLTNEELYTLMDTNFSQTQTGLFGSNRLHSSKVHFDHRITLNGALGDYIRVRVRDNLTGLTELNVTAKLWRTNP